MSSHFHFILLPVDPYLIPYVGVKLPIDLDDFVQHMKSSFPNRDVSIQHHEDGISILMRISFYNDPWVMASFTQASDTVLWISALPEQLAIDVVLWYRQMVPFDQPLFIIVIDAPGGKSGTILEVTDKTTADDVATLYPYLYPFPSDEVYGS